MRTDFVIQLFARKTAMSVTGEVVKLDPMSVTGEVVKLDRKFPLVELADGCRLRCEHSTSLKKSKGAEVRAVIGDVVEVSLPEGHELGENTLGVIEGIAERKTQFVRKDPVDRAVSQTLAANFDQVAIVHPIDYLNMKRLERELVLAHETGAQVIVVLTKSDLVDKEELTLRLGQVRDLAGGDVKVCAISSHDLGSVEKVRNVLGEGTTSILIGSSGAGKSTLVNELLGESVRAVSAVREGDGKGRHTTVSREILAISGEGESEGRPTRIVDMPGVRGLGLWEAHDGIEAAFADIESLAGECRFRDCKHISEPGCAVIAAVEGGTIDESRLNSYRSLRSELEQNDRRKERSSWKNK